MSRCIVDGCPNKVSARKMCRYHHRTVWTNFTTEQKLQFDASFKVTKDLIAGFWEKIEKSGPDDCWPWKNGLVNGYGRFYRGGSYQAHRVAYELGQGPIPPDSVIDHTCRNPLCCNPAHLEAVTSRENVLRGIGQSAHNANKNHCIRGHEFNSENTRVRAGERQCKICANIRYREKRLREREAINNFCGRVGFDPALLRPFCRRSPATFLHQCGFRHQHPDTFSVLEAALKLAGVPA